MGGYIHTPSPLLYGLESKSSRQKENRNQKKKKKTRNRKEEESKVRIQGPRVHHLRLEHMNELDLQKPAENKLNQ